MLREYNQAGTLRSAVSSAARTPTWAFWSLGEPGTACICSDRRPALDVLTLHIMLKFWLKIRPAWECQARCCSCHRRSNSGIFIDLLHPPADVAGDRGFADPCVVCRTGVVIPAQLLVAENWTLFGPTVPANVHVRMHACPVLLSQHRAMSRQEWEDRMCPCRCQHRPCCGCCRSCGTWLP